MSLAVVVLNNEVQKLTEGNSRLKAKIHLMDKQMKTSDPVKKWKFHQQMEKLDQPDSLQKFYVQETFPPADGTAYQGDVTRYEQWKKAKIEGVDESERGFIQPEALKNSELSENVAPGAVFAGTKFIGNTYTRNREESSYMSNSPKSERERENSFVGASQSSVMGGRKRRFRRRANQISRSYVCPLTTCRKAYGSEGSLNQHMKIKHPEYYQSSDLSGRRRGRIGNRHIGFPGAMHPPPPLNHFQMMQSQYQRYG